MNCPWYMDIRCWPICKGNNRDRRVWLKRSEYTEITYHVVCGSRVNDPYGGRGNKTRVRFT